MTSLSDLDTDDYYATLSKQDKGRFEKQFKKNRRNIDIKRAKEQADSIFTRRHIEHLRLVEDIASGFDPSEAINPADGFEFVATNPLCETAYTEADVLLVNTDYNYLYPCIVLCETEGEHSDDWIKNVNQAHRVFSNPDNQEILKSQLGREDMDIGGIQYVTLTRSIDASGVDFTDLMTKCAPQHYAIWLSSRWDQELWHEEGKLVHRQLEEKLIDRIDSGLSNVEINYTVRCHPVLALRQVVFEIVNNAENTNDDYPREFNRSDFADYFENGLQIICTGTERADLIQSEVDRLLEAGKEIGILTDEDERLNSVRDYRIVFSGGTGPEDAKRATKEKYMDARAEEEADKIAFARTKRSFKPKDSTGIDDFT